MLDINNIGHGMKLAEEIGISYLPGRDVVLTRLNAKGELMGGVIYNNYTGVSIMAHMAGFKPRWLSRSFIWVFFDYPFIQLSVKKILATVSSGNRVALAIDRRLGFKEVARVPEVYRDGDMILLEITLPECRWLGRRSDVVRKAA